MLLFLLSIPYSFMLMLLFDLCTDLADALLSDPGIFPVLTLLLWLLVAAAVTLLV